MYSIFVRGGGGGVALGEALGSVGGALGSVGGALGALGGAFRAVGGAVGGALGALGHGRPFWMTENQFRSHFSAIQINKQLFLHFFSKWPPVAILDAQFLSISIGTSLYSRSVATSNMKLIGAFVCTSFYIIFSILVF